MNKKEKQKHYKIVEKQLEGSNFSEMFNEGEKAFKKRLKNILDVDTAWEVVKKRK